MLSFTLVCQLEIVAGSYCFSLPRAFYPDFKNPQYEFSYNVSISSTTPISHLSLPKNAELKEQNDEKTQMRIECAAPSR